MNEKTLFNKNGDPIAYIADDYNATIFLWDGSAVAYIYKEEYVYGLNGRPLGWWIDEILYDGNGDRIAFSSGTCPVAIGKEPPKTKKQPVDEIRPRWAVPPLPKLRFDFASRDLVDFLKEGQVANLFEETPPEASQGEET